MSNVASARPVDAAAQAAAASAPATTVKAPAHATASASRHASGPGAVAIVHDYLNQPGGAERVVLALAQMWPDAPIYTSLYRADSTFPAFGATDIRSSPLDVLPVDDAFRNLFPLYPAAFRSFGVLDHDLVISSSSGWAHSVRTAPHTFHAVYCHSPARWLYEPQHLDDARSRSLRPFVQMMRAWDRVAAQRAQLYIANSAEVRRRISRWYGIDAPVVHPPVEVERFRPTPRGERLLVVSRLLPYKRIDAIVDVATRAGIGLDVVGDGPALEDLRRRAGPTVEFHGRIAEDEAIVELMQSCRALCLPGKEDFGITPIEANAAGKPVIALAAGGALETLEEGFTGAFFKRHSHDEVLAAIRRADAIEATPEEISTAARRFSSRAFEVRLRDVLTQALETHQNGGELLQTAVIAPPRARPLTPPTERPRVLPAAEPATRDGRQDHRGETAAAPVQSARVLMLGHGWFPDKLGGLDRYYRDLLEHLPEARGVVIGGDASTPARVAGVSGHLRPLPMRLLAFWEAAQCQADAVDVVDAQFALYALLPLWLGPLRHKPVVLHFHGPWAYENVASGDGSGIRRRLRLALERAAYRRADQVVVLTSAFRRVLVERYRVPPWIVNVEPPGVDLERFSPGSSAAAREELGLSAEAFVAVAVRRLVPRMGLELLIESWRDCLEHLPTGSTLLIAGEGPLEGELRTLAARRAPDSVRLLGRVSDEQLVTLYRAADVAVVPTLEHEGFGLVVLEAAACGTPSIVTSVGGLPEVMTALDPSLIVAP
jgi:glycosyltransferase involved in cell wall biosynthesis